MKCKKPKRERKDGICGEKIPVGESYDWEGSEPVCRECYLDFLHEYDWWYRHLARDIEAALRFN